MPVYHFPCADYVEGMVIKFQTLGRESEEDGEMFDRNIERPSLIVIRDREPEWNSRNCFEGS